MKKISCSLVIPVYNSSKTIIEVVEKSVDYFKTRKLSWEIILVNDKSKDNSWEIIKGLSRKKPRIKAVNLLKNYGQHATTMCGLQVSKGEYVITMDDDLQVNPKDIDKLLKKAKEGHDVVFAKYKSKKHKKLRNLGSQLVDFFNVKIFDKPYDLKISSFRCIARPVVNRIIENQTKNPYINGLAIMYSYSPGNVEIKHHIRKVGQSTYSTRKILFVLFTILFNYSAFPLRVVSVIGVSISALSFILGSYFLARAILLGSVIVGWASLAILVSFLSGTILLIAGIMGEYLITIVGTINNEKSYYIKEISHYEEE